MSAAKQRAQPSAGNIAESSGPGIHPGVWVIEPDHLRTHIVAGGDTLVATVMPSRTKGRAKAHALLLVSAPKLMEALQRLQRRGWLNASTCTDAQGNADLKFARDSLAAATGDPS